MKSNGIISDFKKNSQWAVTSMSVTSYAFYCDFGLCFCIFQYFSLETLAIANQCGIFTLLVEWEDSVNVRK